jgi:hypothetical protein
MFRDSHRFTSSSNPFVGEPTDSKETGTGVTEVCPRVRIKWADTYLLVMSDGLSSTYLLLAFRLQISEFQKRSGGNNAVGIC